MTYKYHISSYSIFLDHIRIDFVSALCLAQLPSGRWCRVDGRVSNGAQLRILGIRPVVRQLG